MKKFNDIKETYLLACFLKSLRKDKIFISYFEFLSALVKSGDFKTIVKAYSNFYKRLKQSDVSNNDVISPWNKILNKALNEVLNEGDNIEEFCLQDFKEQKHYNERAFIFQNISDVQNEYGAFGYNNYNACLKPVRSFDDIKFSDLKGYESQKEILYKNTKNFLEGKRVNNILLYGDAGCGKSSSVRALVNEFEEINIVQVYKNDIIYLDKLYEILEGIDKKFIIFLDDISFSEEENHFYNLSTIKAIIEGSVFSRPKNVVIYATSNRRHMVKESFNSRIGDSIHLNDTLNEINSLSERFGINLFFEKPNNSEFIEILRQLALDNNLEFNDELIKAAQRFALLKGSKSPRIIKQFVENTLGGISV